MKGIPEFRPDVEHAFEIAALVVSGKMTPGFACARIAEVSVALESPEQLAIFEALDHDRGNHEEFGLTSDSAAAEILKECENLVRNHGKPP